jgi:hypothetical protein
VPRRHPYVGDHDVRRFLPYYGQQRVRVADGISYLVARAVENARQSFAQQQ